MKNWNIILIVLVTLAILAFFVYDYFAAQSEKELAVQAEKNTKNAEILLNEKSIKHRASIYYNLSESEKYQLWKEMFEQCPVLRKVVQDQMSKWGRSYSDQLAIEIDWYKNQRGYHPQDKLGDCPAGK